MTGRWNQILGIVLAVQVALVAFTRWPRSDDDVQSRPLVTFPRDAITEIEITSGDRPGEHDRRRVGAPHQQGNGRLGDRERPRLPGRPFEGDGARSTSCRRSP